MIALTSLDLKDAYFHVPIYPEHRPSLRFAFQGHVYQFQVLPVAAAENLYSGGVSCLGPPPVTGSQDSSTLGRLVDMCSLSISGRLGHREGAGTYSVPRIHCELEENQSAALSTGEFPGSSFQFCNNEHLSNSSEGGQFAESITSFPIREPRDYLHGSETAGVDCSSISGDPLGSSEGFNSFHLHPKKDRKKRLLVT